MICITGSMFNMTALVLTQNTDISDADPTTGTTNGRYEYRQDEISGGLIRVWVADSSGAVTDGNINYASGPMENGRRVDCSVRGVLEGGIRVTATTERFSSRGVLDIVDYVEMEFPANEIITRRDRITDVRDADGKLVWIEEESTNRPTVFEVTGITPVMGPFGTVLKNFTLLSRAEDQASFWEDDEAGG